MAGFDRAAPGYEDNAVLPREVRRRLLERLDYLSIQPEVVVDLGAASGGSSAALAARYSNAAVVAVDLSAGMIAAMPAGESRIQPVCADAASVPLPDASAGLVFSNLMLACCDELDSVLAECRRLSAPEAALTFSTFGPDTLIELRQAWREADGHEHVHAFFDMHDIGEAVMRAGFTEPVLDVETLTLTYSEVDGLLKDLRAMGSVNALPGRRPGLVGTATYQAMATAYESLRSDGRLPASFEIVYAQAWAPASGAGRRPDGTVRFPVDRIGRRTPD